MDKQKQLTIDYVNATFPSLPDEDITVTHFDCETNELTLSDLNHPMQS